MPEFVKDVEEIRRRAISKLEEGPVTGAYQLDKNNTIKILNEALATEIVCVLRYMHHYFMATGVHGRSVADEFKEHADAEREHADSIAERIQQLGGKPDYNPGTLVSRSASQYIEGETLADMIREDLIAERVVIEMYTDMIRFFGDKDPTTRVMIEGILSDEEEHAADLTDLLFIVEPSSGRTEGVDPGTHPLGAHPEQRQQPGAEGRRGPGRETGPAAAAMPPQGGAQSIRPGQTEDELRPARATGHERPEDRDATPAHAPGTTGHPTRERAQQFEDVEPAAENEEGAQMGTTRAVHVTKPNRKKRIA